MISSTETIAMTMMISKSKTASKTVCVFKDYKLIIKPLETKGRERQTLLPCLISYILQSMGNGLLIGLTPCRMHMTLKRLYKMVTPLPWDICPISTQSDTLPLHGRLGVEHLIMRYNHITKEFSSALQKYKSTLATFKRKQVGASSILS
jgi:hypothetical protein